MRQPGDDLRKLAADGLLRELRVLESPQQPRVVVDDQELINFSSNDYLGLANDPGLKACYQQAIERYGVGSGASRLVSGTMAPHIQLEKHIATLKHTEAALTFSSGYATAVGLIPAIVGKDDFVVMDKLCHASLIDGARLSGATMRVFPHNDLEKMRAHLAWANERKQDQSRVLVLVESVYSMDGDRAPLEAICELAKEYGALLLVDEAHGLGVVGKGGLGLASELGLESQIDFQMGTFSKAVGLSGGYVCASRQWVDWLINRARSFIYSTAPAPALAATISEALALVTGSVGDQLRDRLWQHIRNLDAGAESAIVAKIVGTNEQALAESLKLREMGLLVPAIRYPTVPRGTARLRITLSASHDSESVALIGENLHG